MEATLSSRLHHPNVVRFLGLVVDGRRPAIVSELCERGSLHALLIAQSDVPLPWARRWQLAVQLARGVDFLHALQVFR